MGHSISVPVAIVVLLVALAASELGCRESVDARTTELPDAPGAAGGRHTPIVRAGESPPLCVACVRDAPERIDTPMPRYPESASASGSEGLVIVRALIREDGTVGDVQVLRGLSGELDRAAVGAVRRWRFRPAKVDGHPVAVYYDLTVHFVSGP